MVGIVLDYPIPNILCWLLIALSIAFNLYSAFARKKSLRIGSFVTVLHLTVDILQLTALLYLTGGLLNPFSIFLLAPAFISATALRLRETITISTLVMLCTTILMYFHLPLPMSPDSPLVFNDLYVAGIWLSLMSCLTFLVFYAYRVAEEGRNLFAALTATELVLAKETHLSAIDGLAAAAAHELGTPLSTITVVIKELKREWGAHEHLGPEIELLESQTQRCREILGKLSSLNSEEGGPLVALRLTDLVEEVVEPHRNFGVSLDVTRHSSVMGDNYIPLVKRLPGVLYGLGNILENAVDFATSSVNVTIAWDEDAIIIKVIDDGPGFTEGVAARLGEPYITSRPPSTDRGKSTLEGGGLGLGIFIAKTLLERSGATVDFTNRTGKISGADVTVLWPSEAILFEAQPNNRV